jgi:hypothetical protein
MTGILPVTEHPCVTDVRVVEFHRPEIIRHYHKILDTDHKFTVMEINDKH